jgi:hypothetical protein
MHKSNARCENGRADDGPKSFGRREGLSMQRERIIIASSGSTNNMIFCINETLNKVAAIRFSLREIAVSAQSARAALTGAPGSVLLRCDSNSQTTLPPLMALSSYSNMIEALSGQYHWPEANDKVKSS